MRISRTWSIALVLFAAAVLASACATPNDDARAGRGAITNAPQDGAWPMVGKFIATKPGSGICSGALVGDRVVLLAAHCLHDLAEDCASKASFPGTVAFSPSGSLGVLDPKTFVLVPSADNETIAVDDVAWFPDAYDPLAGGCRVLAEHHFIPADSPAAVACDRGDDAFGLHSAKDIALVHLAHPPTSIDPATGKKLEKLPIITNLNESRDLGNTKHFDLDSSFFATLPALFIVGFDGRENRGAGSFDFGGFVPTDKVDSDCFGNTATVSERRIKFTSAFGQTIEHGDSGGPIIVEGRDSALGSSALPPGKYILGVISKTDGGSPTFDVAGEWLDRMLSDWDGDSKPDSEDNCPLAYNPAQENCNAEAERAQQVAVQGDACDVRAPCPDSKKVLGRSRTRPAHRFSV